MSWKTRSRDRARGGVAAAALLLAGAGAAQAQGVEVQTLRPVQPFSIGVMTRSQGGLPDTLWRGSTVALASEAMARVPRDSESLAVNRLIAIALLSGGEPPADAEGDAGVALAAQRLATLVEVGFAAEAADLAARTPDVARRPELAQAQAQAQLTVGDLAGACAAADALQEGREGAFWLRLRAVCLGVAGDARADLTAQLARREDDSAQFERAYALALAGEAQDERVETADPLVFAAARQAQAQVSPARAAPRAMANAAGGPTPEATMAVEVRAARIGLMAPEALGETYEALPTPDLPDDQPAEISLLDAALDAPEGARQALLYRLASEEAAAPDMRAQAIAALLESTESAPAFLLASRVLLPALRTLPEAAGRDDALLLANAASAADEPALARRWLALAQRRPAPAPAGVDPLTGAPVPLGVAPPWSPPDPADIAAAEALIALNAEAPEAAVSRLAGEGDASLRFVDAVVLDAMGKSAEPELRYELLRGAGVQGERADPGVLLALESAADAGAQAEAALLAANALAPGPAELAVVDLARVLRALVRAGLEDAARQAGLEAMLAVRR